MEVPHSKTTKRRNYGIGSSASFASSAMFVRGASSSSLFSQGNCQLLVDFTTLTLGRVYRFHPSHTEGKLYIKVT